MSRTYRNGGYYKDFEKNCRDKKDSSNPPKKFKRLQNRSRRAKQKNALIDHLNGREFVYSEKKTDVWDWN